MKARKQKDLRCAKYSQAAVVIIFVAVVCYVFAMPVGVRLLGGWSSDAAVKLQQDNPHNIDLNSSAIESQKQESVETITQQLNSLGEANGFTAYASVGRSNCSTGGYSLDKSWQAQYNPAWCEYWVSMVYGFDGDFRPTYLAVGKYLEGTGWVPSYYRSSTEGTVERYYDVFYGKQNFDGHPYRIANMPSAVYEYEHSRMSLTAADLRTDMQEYSRSDDDDPVYKRVDGSSDASFVDILGLIASEQQYMLKVTITDRYYSEGI